MKTGRRNFMGAVGLGLLGAEPSALEGLELVEAPQGQSRGGGRTRLSQSGEDDDALQES